MALLSLLTAAAAFSQVAVPDQSETKQEVDETIVLSPFIVDASESDGYRATSTLAGTRIKTELADIAAPISVITRQFIDDVGARDINDILPYVANMESARNYSVYSYSGAIGAYFDDTAANPMGTNRVRGLGTASIARDYFSTIGTRIGFDTYNLDDVTVSRGPNSALFGLGSPAGIINYSVAKAKLNKDHTKTTLSYGSFDDKRATVDINRVLIKDTLAFRGAAVWEDKGFAQQPAWRRNERYYLAGTYKPFAKTTIRADFERAKVNFNNPNSTMPIDNVTPWMNAGAPTWDASTDSLATAPSYFTNAQAGSQTPLLVVPAGSDGTPQYSFQYRQGDPRNVLVGDRAYVKFDPKEPVGIDPMTIRDNRFFDVNKINLRPNPGEMDYTVRHLSLEQGIFDDLSVNLEYFAEKFHTMDLNFLRNYEYNIDVNSKLPDGSVNPHFLETYMLSWTQQNTAIQDFDNKVLRGTLAYKADLTKFNKWLGSHRVSAFAEKREDSKLDQQYGDERINLPSYLTGYTGSINNVILTNRLLYTGAKFNPDGSFQGQTQGTVIPRTGVTGISNTYWDTTTNSWQRDRMDMGYLPGLGGLTQHEVKSQAVVLQSYLLDNRLVGTAGWRKDKDQTNAQTPFTAETLSWGVVARPIRWLSFHYSDAENFVPTGARVTNAGDPIGPQTGTGEDYGFSLDLLDGKLNIKVNKYEMSALNAPVEGQSIAPWELVQMDAGEVPSAVANYNANNGSAADIVYTPASPIHFSGSWALIAGTSDQVSKGLEIELTYNPTKNWRVVANVAQQKAKQNNVEGPTLAFLNERRAVWEGLGPLWNTTNPSYYATSWGNRNLQTAYNDLLAVAVAKLNSAEGKPAQTLREWRANFTTTYSFTEGRLKGYSIGGNARYESAANLGNPIFYDSNGNPTGIDLDSPYKSSADYNFDLWFAYSRRIYNDKIKWSIQLVARDIQSNGGLKVVHANPAAFDGSTPGGQHNAYRVIQPRTFYLNSTFEF